MSKDQKTIAIPDIIKAEMQQLGAMQSAIKVDISHLNQDFTTYNNLCMQIIGKLIDPTKSVVVPDILPTVSEQVSIPTSTPGNTPEPKTW